MGTGDSTKADKTKTPSNISFSGQFHVLEQNPTGSGSYIGLNAERSSRSVLLLSSTEWLTKGSIR